MRLLKPEVYIAGRVPEAPGLADNLDKWPGEALDISADNGSYLSTHLYFPNSWSGPGDLSARIRMCHDGKLLYIGVRVRDNKLTEKDNLTFWLSRENYRIWKENDQKVELFNLGISAPRDNKPVQGENKNSRWSAIQEKDGYYFYASLDLQSLNLSPGQSAGFLFRIGDHDGTPNLYRAGWAMDATMLIPHQENFVNWSDARTCLELKIAE
jgi:hypothetical protein